MMDIQKKTKILQVRFTKDQYDKLIKQAKEEGFENKGELSMYVRHKLFKHTN